MTKSVRVSLRPIVTEIGKVKKNLVERQSTATGWQARKLAADIRKLDKLSASTRGICRGFFI